MGHFTYFQAPPQIGHAALKARVQIVSSCSDFLRSPAFPAPFAEEVEAAGLGSEEAVDFAPETVAEEVVAAVEAEFG